jgi:chemotaxis protein MotB
MSATPGGEKPTIRIVKKKIVAGGHHGGSWKVAYADFVTAMMAFFMVMWIISMDQATKEIVQDFFNSPFSTTRSKAGISNLAMGGRSPIAIGGGVGLNVKNWRELAMEMQRDLLNKAKHTLKSRFDENKDLGSLKDQVQMKMTPYGLSIELIEARKAPFFDSGSAVLPPRTVEVLQTIAKEMGKLPNPIWIEGHTDRAQYDPGAGYTNWELSADRANAARRVMEASGLKKRQVIEVRGFADTRLRKPESPTDPSNRRVAIVVLFREGPPPAEGRIVPNGNEKILKGMPKLQTAPVGPTPPPVELTMEKYRTQDTLAENDEGTFDPGVKPEKVVIDQLEH